MKTKTYKSKKGVALILALILTVIFTCGLFSACTDDNGKKITVSFNLNYPDAPNVRSKEVTVGGKYGLLSIPKRQGYNFIGWYLNSEGEGEVITKDTVVSEKNDHTLYAKWEKKQIVTVNFYVRGEIVSTENVYVGEKYAMKMPDNPESYVDDDGEIYLFRYWYYSLVENPEPKDHIIVDEETEVELDYDHDIIAYFTPFKTTIDFTVPEDQIYFNMGLGYGIDSNGVGGNYTDVTFDDDKKALKIKPKEEIVSQIYCILNLDLENHWRVTYTLETVCASEDEGNIVKCRFTAKGGGSYEELLPTSEKDYNITNGGEVKVSGVIRRKKENQILLIIDISNLTNRDECEFYLKKVEIDTNTVEPLVYDMSDPYHKNLLLTDPQWGETINGGTDYVTLCDYDETKKAFKVYASKNIEDKITQLHVHVNWFENPIWVYAEKQVTWEIEVDTGGATAENIRFRIQGKDTNKPEGQMIFYLNEFETKPFENATYSVTGNLLQDANRLILIIDISELDKPNDVIFYIKKIIIDNIPESEE